MRCKDCVYYVPVYSGYKYGECLKISEKTEEELGLKLNPERFVYDKNTDSFVDTDEDRKKPYYVSDENLNVNLDGIIWHNGGNYDGVSVGENFGCIQFKEK